jgi:putative transposase
MNQIKKSFVSKLLSKKGITISRQCELLNLSLSSFYRVNSLPKDAKLKDLKNEREAIREIHSAHPEYGARRISFVLGKNDIVVGRKLTKKLMVDMGIEAVYPKPNTSLANPAHKVYPYLLHDIEITKPNQVWAADITYLKTPTGWIYLVAIIDWYSRRIISWRLSNSMDACFCIEALKEALEQGRPEIFNTDQGSQFTSNAFTQVLLDHEIRISMDGKGRATDNVIIERFWRTIKYEHIFLHDYQSIVEFREGISKFIKHYNFDRPHQSHQYAVPDAVWRKAA